MSGAGRAMWKLLSRPVCALGHSADHPLQTDTDSQPDRVRQLRIRRMRRWLLRRLLLAPVLLAAVMLVLVYGTTHRLFAASSATTLPSAANVFYRNVELTTDDGEHLAAWYVPALSAADVVRDSDRSLRQRRAALVLCHGPWSDRSQLLYLVPALHAAGYELLLPDLRGCGESTGHSSLGLEEYRDVQAACDWLARMPSVDARRIGVIASQTSASAALRAAASSPQIRLVIADRPAATLADFAASRFSRMHLPGRSLGLLYEWSLALWETSDPADASARRWVQRLQLGQRLLIATRYTRETQADRVEQILPSDPAARTMLFNPHRPDDPRQPALLPGDVLRFLDDHLPVLPRPDPVAWRNCK